MSAEPLGRVFAALADPTRRAVVLELGAGETATATELARRHPMSRQAIAKHLAVLEEAGLVTHARRGRETRYALDAAPLGDAASWLATAGATWDDRLARLASAAQQRT